MDMNIDSMLNASAPRSKTKKQLEQTSRIKLAELTPEQEPKIKTEDDNNFFPKEFRSYGTAPTVPILPSIDENPEPDEPTEPVPTTELPIIDLFVLSKNCSEYILLNEQYTNALITNPDIPIIDRYSHIQKQASHNYYKYIQEEMRKSLNLTKIEFNTETYIFRDYIWDDYVLDFNTKDTLLINVFFSYVKSKKIDTTKFIILATDKATSTKPVLNHTYCNDCAFKNICQRRSLEEN